MKIKTFILFSMMLMLLCSPLWAFEIEGEIGARGMLADVDGNEAKFNEYTDRGDGLYGKFHLDYESDGYFLRGTASDIGYDTQHYRLEGGMWGSFRYYLDYDEIIHNYTFNARSFYSGIGSERLTGSPNTDPESWSTFDYSIERKTYGGGVKLDIVKPFYIFMSASREDREGTRPTAAEGAIGFGRTVELPEPVDYVTDTLKVEAGYSKDPFFGSLGFMYSSFDNDHERLYFDNAFIEGNPRDVLTLPPDNEYYKIAFKNAVKLPLNSKFNMNLGYSQTKSDQTLIKSFLDDGEQHTLSLNDSDFDGRIDTENYDFVLTSNPFSKLEGKMFYKYYRRKNKSDEIVMTENDESLENDLFSYRKNRYGIELGFRLPANLHLLSAYTHVDTNRNRDDVSENKDDVYKADLSWTGLDFMEITAGYQKITRTADFNPMEADPDDPEILSEIVRRFDVAPKDRDIYSISFDFYPIRDLTIGIGYRNTDTDYRDTILGLKESDTDEFSIDGTYTLAERVVLAGYYYYERMTHCQVQRRLAFNAASGFDPGTPPTEDAFNWQAKERNETYEYGVGADVSVIPKKLTLRLNHSSVKSDGDVNYTFFLGTNPLPSEQTQDNIDLSDWDEYRIETYAVKAIYTVSSKIKASAAYLHQRFSYDDAQYDSYRYILGSPPNTYLTGAYKDQSYDADIVFVSLAYSF